MGTLSGGQQRRVALANVLATEPDMFVLDEPTNHLDLDMIEWLEGFLSRGNKTLLMVTHDRFFIYRDVNINRYGNKFAGFSRFLVPLFRMIHIEPDRTPGHDAGYDFEGKFLYPEFFLDGNDAADFVADISRGKAYHPGRDSGAFENQLFPYRL